MTQLDLAGHAEEAKVKRNVDKYMGAKLVAEEGLLKGLVLSFEAGDQWIVGRDPDACQLLIEDPSASRKHLVCRNTPEGIVLENLSHTNPVQVNDEELKSPRLLLNGDTVKIGNGVYRYYSESGAHLFNTEGQGPLISQVSEVTGEESQERPSFAEDLPYNEETKQEKVINGHAEHPDAPPAEQNAPLAVNEQNETPQEEPPEQEQKHEENPQEEKRGRSGRVALRYYLQR